MRLPVVQTVDDDPVDQCADEESEQCHSKFACKQADDAIHIVINVLVTDLLQVSNDSLNVVQLRLEAVDGQVFIGQRRTHAVLAEAVGMDAQLAEHRQHGREDEAVALQLDDDQGSHRAVAARHAVVELEGRVDGQPLRHGLVDQRDATEVVVHVRLQRAYVIAQMMGQEVGLLPVAEVHVAHLDALLLRAPVVVLRLHLKVVNAYMEIGTHAQLLALQMAHLMTVIHRAVLRIVVECIIRCDDLAVDLLHVILVAGELKQPSEHGHRRDELRIDAVHQADVSHLVERDGLEMAQNLCHTFAVFECKGRQIHHSGKTFSVNGYKFSTKR